MRPLFVPVVLLAACGDPDSHFLGTWIGPESITVDFGGGPESISVGTVMETFSENNATGAVDFSECGWSATVVNATTMDIKIQTTPCIASNDGTCATALSASGGAGVVSGNSMTLDIKGSAGVSCTDGTTKSGPFTAHSDLTRH